jgi:PII-like signaling protein
MSTSEPVDALQLTVYTGDSFRYEGKRLYRAVVELLHAEGIAGATVLHGIEGYGGDKRIHTSRILDLSDDLPVVVVAVDRAEKIESVFPKLDEMVERGLVTTQPVRVILSRPAEI